jgi:hypothetical protein
MSRLNEQGLRPTYLMPKLRGALPEVKVGDRVRCKGFGCQEATVIKKVGYRLRVRFDSGLECSRSRIEVWGPLCDGGSRC